MISVRVCTGSRLSLYRSVSVPFVKPALLRFSSSQPAKQQQAGSLFTTKQNLIKLRLPLPLHHNKSPVSTTFLLHPEQPLSYLERLIAGELQQGSDLVEQPSDNVEINFLGFSDMDPDVEGDEIVDGRWSRSTHLGSFIREATQTKDFSIVINTPNAEQPLHIKVKIPTFEERTKYIRQKLEVKNQEIKELLDIKEKCDQLAARHTRHIAYGALGGVAAYSAAVYHLTFNVAGVGWDVMEPVTYLVSLSAIMAGSFYFITRQREVSYSGIYNDTHSRRQHALYQQHNFDVERWHDLMQDARQLRGQLQTLAEEYGVKDWRASAPATEKVEKVLKKEKGKEDEKIDEKHEKKKNEYDD